jgi:ferric-dicitrate binding protein FerR (iron transport regulator)
VETNKTGFTKISVIEGSVEVSLTGKNEVTEIPEGYEAIINGETLTKRKIEKLEKWWER